MPSLSYYRPTDTIKEIRLRDILPVNIKTKGIHSIKLRFYRSETDNHSFFCSVCIPNHKDDEGNALEIFVEDIQFIKDMQKESVDIYQPELLHVTDDDRFDAVDEIDAVTWRDDDMEFNTYIDRSIPNQGYFYEAMFDGSFSELPKRTTCQFAEHGRLIIRVKDTAFYGFVYLGDYLETANLSEHHE